ncbi:MAG: Gfo/Idh/MocA family oxidoreductase [Pirellulaceae bacterium]|nr:Gfo/Idh/MocA family oxidoreductase [Pirellulaceae bacterium]
MSEQTRRSFLQKSMMATASAYALSQAGLATSMAEGAQESSGDKLRCAVIGAGGRGGSHISGMLNRKDVVITHICDVDEKTGGRRCEDIGKAQGQKPSWVPDIRKLLDDKSIDFVTIATPNHWHSLAAIYAVQAGKDVYVEKPVSHNVLEGRRLVQVARKHNKIVQTGTQCRSNPGMRDAMAFIHGGGIGDVTIARGLCYKRRKAIGARGEYPVPAGIDYDLWLGPAPKKPLTRPNFHYDWHWQWDYGNGDLGNQGIHQMDLCRWALNKNTIADSVVSYGGRFGYEDAGETANTQIVQLGYGSQQLVFEVRGLETKDYRGANVGIIIEGTKGYLMMSSYDTGVAFDADGKEIKKFKGGGDQHHYANFLDAVRSRDYKKLNADVEEGHLSSALCHLGNISMRMGKPIAGADVPAVLKEHKGHEDMVATFKRTAEHLTANSTDPDTLMFAVGPMLKLDPKAEVFTASAEANTMLTREYRAPYTLPSESEV